METNASIYIYREATNWKHEKTASLVGSYDVWLEQTSVYAYDSAGGGRVREKLGDGLVILQNDLDLTGCYWQGGSTLTETKKHEFKDWDRFIDKDGSFHHIEAVYG